MNESEISAGSPAARNAGGARVSQRVLLAALALALVGGPLAGFQLGQRLGDRERVPVASEGDDPAGSPLEDPADGDDSTRSAPESSLASPDAGAGGAFSADRSIGHGYGLGHELDRVGTAEFGDAVIRLFRTDHGVPDDGNPTWDPPVGCYPTGSFMAQASTPGMVAVVSGEVFGLQPTEGVVQLVGVAEGDPHWIAVGHTAAEDITVRFADGRSEVATIVDGVFTAAAPAPEADLRSEPTAVVVAAGQESTITGWSGPVDDDFHRQCEPPPPALRPAGEQPPDPDAARAEIAEAFQLGYGGGEGQLDAFVDPEQMRPAFEELDASESFEQYRGKIVAVVGQVVFDTPTHAWLFYDLEPVVSQRIGEAVLTDRGWKVANATICADVAMAGVRCE